jgi:AraC family transcriptional activator of pobA
MAATAFIPHYALYGDPSPAGWADFIGCEPINQRARIHDFFIEPHRHQGLFQILYFKQGGGVAHIDGKRWAISPECLVIVPANSVHGFQFESDSDGPVITAAQRPVESLASAFSPELLQTIRCPGVVSVAHSPLYREALAPLFEAIGKEAQINAPARLAAGAALLLALFVQIARIREMGDFYANAPSGSRRAQQIERFRAMVEARFRDGVSIADSARELGLTAGQLSRLCRETLGVSARDIVNARIVKEAERELIYSTMLVKEIALYLGFADEAYFGRFFRSQTQMTPTEFRKAARRHLTS